jgi:hypothetical protein
VIVVVSFRDNRHVGAVVEHLRRPTTVFDAADFPTRATLEVRLGDTAPDLVALQTVDGPLRSDRVGAVWYRRERPMQLDPALTDQTARLFAWSESHEGLHGFWRTTDCFWMNPPDVDALAQRKVRQLQVAREVGLRIPATLITNSPQQAAGFIEAHSASGVVRKAFRNIAEAPRSTALVTSEDLDRIGDVRFAPVTFQEFVPATLDLRVVAVEDELFATAIRSDADHQVDSRMGLDTAELSPYRLPDDVASPLLDLHKRLGLAYGASDLRVTPEGEHVFLEVNPAGEFLFASERTGQPVPQAIAACLTRHDKEHCGC